GQRADPPPRNRIRRSESSSLDKAGPNPSAAVAAKEDRMANLFGDIEPDEGRVRVKGSIQIKSDEELTENDGVEIVLKGHVVKGSIERFKSGLWVREYTVEVDGTEIRRTERQLSLAEDPE